MVGFAKRYKKQTGRTYKAPTKKKKSSGGTPNRVSTKATDTYGTVGPAGWQPNQNVQQTSTLSNNTFKGSGSNVVRGGSGAPTSGARRIGDAADAKGMTTWEGIKNLKAEHYLAAGGAELIAGGTKAVLGQIAAKTGPFASKAGKAAFNPVGLSGASPAYLKLIKAGKAKETYNAMQAAKAANAAKLTLKDVATPQLISNLYKARQFKTAAGTRLNVKTVGHISKFMASKTNTRIAIALGTAGLTWLGSVGFGLWGQAEAPEAPTITASLFLADEAEKTGDWTAFNDAIAGAEELANTNVFEDIALMSPGSAIVGSINKAKGIKQQIDILKQYGIDKAEQAANGESDKDYWARIRENEQLDIQANRDDAERRAARNRELELKQQGKDAAFWARQRAEERKLEEEAMEKAGKFWLDYKKQILALEAAAIQSSSYTPSTRETPSTLKFGLL